MIRPSSLDVSSKVPGLIEFVHSLNASVQYRPSRGSCRLRRYSRAGCELFRFVHSSREAKMSTVNDGAPLIFSSILACGRSRFLSLNFSILYSLYKATSSISRNLGNGVLAPQLWHL